MRNFKSLAATAFALLTLVFLASPTLSHAQEPKYLHALSNLRQARAWLQWDHNPYTADARHHAVGEIDKAIDEVKKAAQDDGRDTNFTPPPSAQAQGGGAVHSAKNLLDVAFGDIKYGYDNPANAGLQERAKQHISEAQRICLNIMNPQ
jgi:tetratricopeptide (TPR) repeat protein